MTTNSIVQFDDALRAAANRAVATYPDETRRILRGLRIAQKGDVSLDPDGNAMVESQSVKDKWYQVGKTGCACHDATYQAPAGRCMHVFSRWLCLKAQKLMQHPGYVKREYYATYHAPWGHDIQGIATWYEPDKRWIFSTDAYPHAHYAESTDLTLGGHVLKAEIQRQADGDFGEKFGRPQYPEVDHAASDARLAERKARRERGWGYGN